MLFNSFNFILFLPVVFALHWFVFGKSARGQNILLLLASYYFYASWDYRFLFLLLLSTLLDFYSGMRIATSESPAQRKRWLILSVVTNLAFLSFFKYYNFFVESFISAISGLGWKPSVWTLNIILPIGISFYTFHGLSYVLDIYNRKTVPSGSFLQYGLFVSFFPLLVAGPIERATSLLPQLREKRIFQYRQAVLGLRQILWGFFKKIVIADNCAVYADIVFNNASNHHGSTLLVGAFFFSIQIYSDFSGYSDIALGTARLFGVELLRNFAFPYFSRDIAEFWRRWHISLTSWFRDYLYLPLGGSKINLAITVRNTFVVFLVSGFWHGANWTFVAWGFIHALYFLPYLLLGKNRDHLDIVASGKWLPSIGEFFQMAFTFILTLFAWIFFRAVSIGEALHFISNIFSAEILAWPSLPKRSLIIVLLVIFFMAIEWMGKEKQFALERFGDSWGRWARWAFYITIICLTGMFMQTTQTPFIYFQF